jgi:hypothetical protein
MYPITTWLLKTQYSYLSIETQNRLRTAVETGKSFTLLPASYRHADKFAKWHPYPVLVIPTEEFEVISPAWMNEQCSASIPRLAKWKSFQTFHPNTEEGRALEDRDYFS